MDSVIYITSIRTYRNSQALLVFLAMLLTNCERSLIADERQAIYEPLGDRSTAASQSYSDGFTNVLGELGRLPGPFSKVGWLSSIASRIVKLETIDIHRTPIFLST